MNGNESPRETLELMLGHLGFVFEIEEEDRLMGRTLHVRMSNPSRLIGRGGETLEDLQFLFNRILSVQNQEAERVIIDIESYRVRQQEDLLDYVKTFANQVQQTGKSVQLPPMNSFERRIVHLAYKEDPHVETVSSDEQNRLKRITLQPKKG